MKLFLVLFLVLFAAAVVSSTRKSKARCPRPAVPYYGHIRKGRRSSYTVGKRITIACKRGYILVGSSSIKCLQRGQLAYWNPHPPVCKELSIVCPKLPAPANGRVWNKRSTAKFRCNSGFKLRGSSKRKCKSIGWTGTQPTCEPKYACPTLYNPANGYVKIIKHGSKAVYKCNSGFKLRGHSKRSCKSNKWTGKQPFCQPRFPQCPRLAAPENGKVSFSKKGSKAVYKCNSGFILKGSSKRFCKRSGWTGSAPTCQKPIQCPRLVDPENGDVSFRQTVGSIAVYKCNKGFTLIGSEKRTCQQNGAWTGQQPTCKLVPICKHPYSPLFGSVQVKGFGVGAVAHYTCSKGYKLIGYQSIPCTPGGVWKYHAPICSPFHIYEYAEH